MYNKFSENNEDVGITFGNIRRGLQKIVSGTFVKNPKTARDVVEAFTSENVWYEFGLSKCHTDPQPFFKACIEDHDFSFCIFMSTKSINLIKSHIPPCDRKYLMDATFKIVPQGCFNQLLIVYISYLEQQVIIDNSNNRFFSP